MFKKIPVNKNAISKRGTILSIGINDAPYLTSYAYRGVTYRCPAYSKWSTMIDRCYNPAHLKRKPTYIGCSVCDSWLLFSNFEAWFSLNNVDGYHLDKDIKVKGNKVYSPETCLFLPKCINLLLTDSRKTRGSLPIGVDFKLDRNKYRSSLSVSGKRVHLGYFENETLAYNAYVKAKNEDILSKCKQFPEFKQYLVKHLYK